jgi:RimJ/RimL family protein N-acetyltransferase/catechol 2,3-dioxygenase-like lactoylglutathione lyase family enzyme
MLDLRARLAQKWVLWCAIRLKMEKTFLPDEILAERIILKRHEPKLAARMFQAVDHGRQRLRVFLPWVDSTRTVDDTAAYIASADQKWKEQTLFDYGLFRLTDQAYMGNCGVRSIAWDHSRCEIGYWIAGAYEGQGFISEALRSLERILFATGFHRIEIRCSSRNERSANVLRRNRYCLEGVLKHESIEHGAYRDTCVFAKLHPQSPAPAFLIVDHARLFVLDLARSRAWYVKALGVDPIIDLPDYVEFRIGQAGLALSACDEKSPFSPGGQVAYWRAASLENATRHFFSLGATLYRGPLAVENGEAVCQIRDPFGNVLGLIGP